MIRPVQECRVERGESRSDLAAALGVTLDEIAVWEQRKGKPMLSRTPLLSEHLGVRDDQINEEPNRPPPLGEQLRDALEP